MHQKPSVSSVAGWNHTGASRRSTSNISWGTAATKLPGSARFTSSRVIVGMAGDLPKTENWNTFSSWGKIAQTGRNLMHELIVRGGTVVDGTGGPAFAADVAVDGGKVTEVGRIAG